MSPWPVNEGGLFSGCTKYRFHCLLTTNIFLILSPYIQVGPLLHMILDGRY